MIPADLQNWILNVVSFPLVHSGKEMFSFGSLDVLFLFEVWLIACRVRRREGIRNQGSENEGWRDWFRSRPSTVVTA